MEIEHKTEIKFNGHWTAAADPQEPWDGDCKTMINPILEFKENRKGAG